MNCCHNPIHCILPPFVLEHMASSPDEAVRKLAIEAIALANLGPYWPENFCATSASPLCGPTGVTETSEQRG
jgi:hypothetical protein